MNAHRLPGHRMIRNVLIVALALLASAPAYAYVIIMTDGTRLVAKEKPTIQGDRVIFLTSLGTAQSIPLAEFDQKKTDEVNRLGTGDAYVLPDGPDDGRTVSLSKKASLSEFIKTHKATKITFGAEPTPVPEPAGKRGAREAPQEKLATGELSSQGVDPRFNDAFLRALESSGIRGPRLSPLPHGLKVQALTDNEQQVFAAIGAVARGMKESRAAGRPLDKAELYLGTSAGDPAGHFEMTPDDAEALLNGKVGVAKYYVANVIF
jgi:hypothetical protein